MAWLCWSCAGVEPRRQIHPCRRAHKNEEVHDDPGEDGRQQIAAADKEQRTGQNAQVDSKIGVNTVAVLGNGQLASIVELQQDAGAAKHKYQARDIPVPAVAYPKQIGAILEQRLPGATVDRHDLLKP